MLNLEEQRTCSKIRGCCVPNQALNNQNDLNNAALAGGFGLGFSVGVCLF